MKMFVLSLGCLLAGAVMAGEGFAGKDGEYIDVLQGDKPRLRYMHKFDISTPELKHDFYKPYCHVLAPDGETPITKGPGGKFTHHRGIFLGWSKIGFQGKSYDLWHMKNGYIVHQDVVSKESGPDANELKVKLSWETADKVRILDETRTISLRNDDADAYLTVDFVCELTAVGGDVSLNGDPEHAGFQYRPHNDVVGNKSAKYVYHEEGLNVQKARDVPWVGMTYKLGEDTYTVQHMNHPDNPKGTRYSAYRDYGRFGAFAVKKLEKDESLTLRYRIRITTGAALTRDAFATQYQSYVK